MFCQDQKLQVYSDHCPGLPVIAEMFVIAVRQASSRAVNSQEVSLFDRARSCIGEHYGYQAGDQVPDVAIDMYIHELISELRDAKEWPGMMNADQIVNTVIDWGMACGLINRPACIVLH